MKLWESKSKVRVLKTALALDTLDVRQHLRRAAGPDGAVESLKTVAMSSSLKTFLTGVGLALLSSFCVSGSVQGQEVEHLDGPTALKAVCRSADPKPPQASGDKERREHFKDRQSRLVKVYSVDVMARDFSIAGFDHGSGQLSIAQPSHALFGGGYALEFVGGSLIVFDVPKDVGERLEMEHSSGRVLLRVYFLLESLGHPETTFCREDGVLTVKGQLVGARLWRSKEAGDAINLGEVLSSFDLFVGRGLASLMGPKVEAREPRGMPRVHAHLMTKASSPLDEAQRLEFKRDIELALMPCFLSALSSGMQPKGALTFEVTFLANRLNSATVNTDQAGFPPLTKCAEAALLQVSRPSAKIGTTRLTVYFDGP